MKVNPHNLEPEPSHVRKPPMSNQCPTEETKRAPENQPAKISKKRASASKKTQSTAEVASETGTQRSNHPKEFYNQLDELVYAPIRRMQQELEEWNERLRVQARNMNLFRRLDAIQFEFDCISKEINGIVNLLMNSYGYHCHKGQWRRRRAPREELWRLNCIMSDDRKAANLQIFENPPAWDHPAAWFLPWDPRLGAHASSQTDSLGAHASSVPNSLTKQTPTSESGLRQSDARDPLQAPNPPAEPKPFNLEKDTILFYPISSYEYLHPRKSLPPATPVWKRDDTSGFQISNFQFEIPNSTTKTAKGKNSKNKRSMTRNKAAQEPPSTWPAPLPPVWKLPHNPPRHPLFPRAMDGTTFVNPRPEPPEPPDPLKGNYGYATPFRRPTSRQILHLYDVAFAAGKGIPFGNRYTDIRVLLKEVTPEGWTRYPGFFYSFFKRRILDRKPGPCTEPPKKVDP